MLAVLGEEIGQRREAADLDARTDVLSLLLQAESGGDHLEDDEVLHNLLTMVLAGHDTTATALAWTFDLLLHHPVATDRLRADLATGSRDYIGATIRESMRLRPVVLDVGRALVQPTRIGDAIYPSGTVVSPSILLAHHRADIYPDPMKFRPSRSPGSRSGAASAAASAPGLRCSRWRSFSGPSSGTANSRLPAHARKPKGAGP